MAGKYKNRRLKKTGRAKHNAKVIVYGEAKQYPNEQAMYEDITGHKRSR